METHVIGEAAILGIAAGMRATVPLAALGLTLPRRRWPGASLALASAAELGYDKLPQAEKRTAPGPLAARVVSGAIAGSIVARVADEAIAVGAATGALAAFVSAWIFHRGRTAAARHVPPLAAAVAEDLIAIGAVIGVLRRLRR